MKTVSILFPSTPEEIDRADLLYEEGSAASGLDLPVDDTVPIVVDPEDDDDLGDYPDGDEDDESEEDDDDFEDLSLDHPKVKPSPFKSKSLPTTRNLAARYDESGKLVPADTDEGEHVKGWIENGVPSVKGVERNGVITEEPTVVPPDSPVFGLALLEAIEKNGWSVG